MPTTMKTPCACDNCGHECDISKLDEATHLWERLDFPIGHPDCIEPAGECPKCGALSYEKDYTNEIRRSA